MCGIAGIIGSVQNAEILKKMLSVQSHRGPDHTGTYQDKNFAVLGHNRLSIIDLSPNSNEPFADSSGRYYLTFNGEIYNYIELKNQLKDYSFRTNSDTEILLAAYIKWGEKCLDKFIGMFSFAIWDSKNKTLFAARDRFGVKPFYYKKVKDKLIFASEIKAIKVADANWQWNQKVWAIYFAYGSYGLPDDTFYQDIYQLPAGHFLHFSKGKIKIDRWYHFEQQISKIDTNYSFKEAKENYFELLKNSLLLRFRADVPLGFNISGGVDSSLLLAMVNLFENQKDIKAYTFFTGNTDYDEVTYAEKLIQQYKNP